MEKTPYETGGFAFPNRKMMEKAQKEAEGIRFVKSSADLNDPRVVYGVYCQLVRQELFETPVGYAFLSELQEYLKADLSINNEDIPAIPVIASQGAPAKQTGAKERQKSSQASNHKTAHKPEVKNADYKVKFKASLTVCVILILMIAGMFAVTLTSRNNVNILNYENAIIEKYENWESELEEREKQLREREAEPN
ncbi:MAG: hypothetical protein HFJ04_00105 [Lachnospiraceae bacterium]|nr:hypothetical protein [Lachnospiraceae bacterium]